MAERVTITDEPAPAAAEPAANGPAAAGDTIEYRVRRLEDAVAALQDTREIEDRLAERVARRIGRNALQAMQDSAGVIVDAGRRLLPKAIEVVRPPVPPPAEPVPATKTSSVRHEWLLIDAYEEARSIYLMYLDRRYRPHLSWSARITPLLLLFAILTSWVWVPGTMLLWFPLALTVDILVNLLLAYFLYKVLSREARRYREMFSG